MLGTPISVDRDIMIKYDSKCNHCKPKLAKPKGLLLFDSQHTFEYESIERIWSIINRTVKGFRLSNVSENKRVNKVIKF